MLYARISSVVQFPPLKNKLTLTAFQLPSLLLIGVCKVSATALGLVSACSSIADRVQPVDF